MTTRAEGRESMGGMMLLSLKDDCRPGGNAAHEAEQNCLEVVKG